VDRTPNLCDLKRSPIIWRMACVSSMEPHQSVGTCDRVKADERNEKQTSTSKPVRKSPFLSCRDGGETLQLDVPVACHSPGKTGRCCLVRCPSPILDVDEEVIYDPSPMSGSSLSILKKTRNLSSFLLSAYSRRRKDLSRSVSCSSRTFVRKSRFPLYPLASSRKR